MTVSWRPPRERWRQLEVVPKSELPWAVPEVVRPTFVAPGYLALPEGWKPAGDKLWLEDTTTMEYHQPVTMYTSAGPLAPALSGDRQYGPAGVAGWAIFMGAVSYISFKLFGDEYFDEPLTPVAIGALAGATYATFKNYVATRQLFPA